MRRGDARTIHKKSTVHRPKNMTPYELQMEHIKASKRIYSVKRLINALIFEDFVHKALFIGEFLWHWSVRSDLKRELKNLPREYKVDEIRLISQVSIVLYV